jgi:hypothetical protein
MNEIQIVFIFFAFLFAGSLLYSAKKKRESLFSYIVNLEFEYVFAGVAIFFLMKDTSGNEYAMNAAMHLLLTFMGLALGTHFSFKLLKDVPFRFYLVTAGIYLSTMPFFYYILQSLGCKSPFIMSIALNTLMPYSLNLSVKLFKIPKDRVFVSNLITSLFPLLTLIAYTIGAGALDYRPIDFFKAMAGAILLAVIFTHYGKAKTKKNINKLSILFVVMLSGIAMYSGISPLVVGFLTGLIKSDTKYGNIFQNISISFERILYIFFYVALGVMLGFGYNFSIQVFITAGALYIAMFLTREIFAKFIINSVLPTKGEVVSLMSTGILPAVILMDFGTRHGYMNIAKLFMPFVILHAMAEITTYFKMKNERNGH